MNTLYVQNAIHNASVGGKTVVLVTSDDNYLPLLKEVSGFIGTGSKATGQTWVFEGGGMLRVAPVSGDLPLRPFLLAPHAFKSSEYPKLFKWRQHSTGELRWD
jgi:hypothetical protein